MSYQKKVILMGNFDTNFYMTQLVSSKYLWSANSNTRTHKSRVRHILTIKIATFSKAIV